MRSKLEAEKSLMEAAARFVRTCASATDAEWVHRESPDAWSIGDVVEHATIANGNVLRRLNSIADHPLSGAQPDVEDDEMPYLFYRGDEPPNIATPTGLMHRDRATAKAFGDGIGAVVEFLQANKIDLRTFGVPHPLFGTLDGVQWLLFCAAHTERHRAQVQGILHRQRLERAS